MIIGGWDTSNLIQPTSGVTCSVGYLADNGTHSRPRDAFPPDSRALRQLAFRR